MLNYNSRYQTLVTD